MYELFEIIAHNQGKRELCLTIKSKLADIQLQTGFKVTSKVEDLIKKNYKECIHFETYLNN